MFGRRRSRFKGLGVTSCQLKANQDSLLSDALSWMPVPEVFMATVRAHWAIENALHWQLDVSFREAAARNRKDNGPANIAILRRCAAPSTSPAETHPRDRSRSN